MQLVGTKHAELVNYGTSAFVINDASQRLWLNFILDNPTIQRGKDLDDFMISIRLQVKIILIQEQTFAPAMLNW